MMNVRESSVSVWRDFTKAERRFQFDRASICSWNRPPRRRTGRVKGRKMNLGTKAALLVSGFALVVSPAVALASGAPSNPGAPDNQGTQTATANKPSDTGQPGPGASLPAKARAYGRY